MPTVSQERSSTCSRAARSRRNPAQVHQACRMANTALAEANENDSYRERGLHHRQCDHHGPEVRQVHAEGNRLRGRLCKDDADADEHIMRDRFTFNRKTVMRAARNVAVPQPDWRSCCASANPIRRWRSERASRQATGLVRAGESLSDQRFTRFCCDEYG